MAHTAASIRTSLTAGCAGNTFANSKFFMKKQNRAAIRIQAMCRAFLVQARLYRQRNLEPLLKDLKDCEARKTEELRRIQEEFEEERQALPERMKKEAEDSAFCIDNLKREIEIFTKVGEELKEGRKEEKRKNRELDLEAKRLNDASFKLEVQNMKLANEVKEIKATAEKYEWALEGGKMQLEELQQSILKACHQQGVFTKYINKIIKKVEERSKEPAVSPPNSPKQRRKSLGKKEIAVTDESSPPKEKRKSLNKKDGADIELSLLDLMSSDPKDRRKSMSMSKSMSKSNMFSGDQTKSLHQSRSKRRQSIKEGGNASFNWATYDSKSEGIDEENEDSIEDLVAAQPEEDHACFDWATKSYNWGTKSAELNGEGEGAETTQGRRKPRRHTSTPVKCSSHRHHHSSKTNKAMKELVHELKAIKKQGLKPQ